MNKRGWVFFFAMYVFGVPALCLAHIGDRVFLAFEINDNDLAEIDLNDGSIEDWENVVGDPSVVAVDHEITGSDSYNPLDFDFRIWIAWNQTLQRIYVAVDIVDDIAINQYAGGDLAAALYHDGAVQFMIDGNHSGGQYGFAGSDSLSLLANNHTAQRYIGLAQAPDGNHIGYLGAGANWVNGSPYADGGGVTGPCDIWPGCETRHIIEFYVTPFDCLVWNEPGRSIVSSLIRQEKIGFDVSIADFDRAPGQSDSFFSLTGRAESWRFADQFADLWLIDGFFDFISPAFPSTPCIHDSLFHSFPTVAPPASWARIKASFRQ